MKKIILIIGCIVLTACASSAAMKEEQAKVAALQGQITELQAERERVSGSLESLQTRGESLSADAESLRGRLRSIDEEIATIESIKRDVAANKKGVAKVSAQQSKQHKAMRDALEKNRALKDSTADEIKALEQEYEDKRKKSDDNTEEG